jgi:hypothetical protein
MRVQKTLRRHGVTLEHGSFVARETAHVCAAGCRRDGASVTHRAATLAARLPPMGIVGDVIVCRSARFRRAPATRGDPRAVLLEQDGGWPLHVDATGEDGRGTLLVAFAGWRRWVLGAWKVPTERAEVILPRLRAVTERFGAPCAIMRDLGRAVTDACQDLVAARARDIPVLACHLHILRDVGGDLLDAAHDQLRTLFRRFKVKPRLRALARDLGRTLGPDIAQARQGLSEWQTQVDPGHVLPDGQTGLATVRAMAQWVLDYHADGHDQGVPFDLPYLDLFQRCHTAGRAADAFLRQPIRDARVSKTLGRLRRLLHPIDSQVPFEKVAATLRARAALFTELRDALRLRPKPSGRNGPAPQCPLRAGRRRTPRHQAAVATASSRTSSRAGGGTSTSGHRTILAHRTAPSSGTSSGCRPASATATAWCAQ